MAIRTEALRESTPTSGVGPRQGRKPGPERPFDLGGQAGGEGREGREGGAPPEGGPLAPEASTAAFLSLDEVREPLPVEEAREAYEEGSEPRPRLLDLEG